MMTIRYRWFYILMAVWLVGATGVPIRAQKKGALKPSIAAAPTTVKPGEKFEVKVALNLPSGMHINSNKPEDEFTIATEMKMSPAAGFTLETPRYPAGKKQTFNYAPKGLTVYEGAVQITVPVQVSKDTKPGQYPIKGQFRWQPCDANVCYPPEKADLTVTVQVK